MAATEAHPYRSVAQEDCVLTALKQYECSPQGSKVTCWPFERIFRQCGRGPVIEVTNHLVDGETSLEIDPKFLNRPPKGKLWKDLRP